MHATLPLAAYRRLLGIYLRPQRARVLGLAGLLAAGIGLQLLNPQILRYFIDTAQAGGNPGALAGAAVAFIALGLAARGLDLATTYVGANVGWIATNALRADLALHLLRLDMPFHKRHTPGELIERVDGDVTALANFFAEFVLRIAGNGVLVAGILVLLYAASWPAGLALTVYTAVTLAVLLGMQNFGARRWIALRQAEAEQFGFLEEHIGGTEDIRGSGAEAYVLRRLHDLMRNRFHKGRAATVAGSLSFALTNFLLIAGYGLGLALGAWLYTTAHVTLGTAFLVVYYIGMLATPLENVRGQAEDLQRAGAGVARVRELFALQPQVAEVSRAALPAGALAVDFAGVSFAYDDGEGGAPPDPALAADGAAEPGLVLHDVSFAVAPGRVLGVLGRTGSGKTTLTRLLFRLYDPTAGRVRLGGVEVRDVALADLRAHVGMVTQDVQLFQATLRENIAFFNPRVDDAAIARALAELGLRDWVGGLPAGLDTRLGAGGQGMSAGEAQLLAFTRVLLKDPGLIILDEAASRLDPATERRLERAVDRMLAGRTAIIIAHRLHTVERADDVLILDGGRVVEYGPRAALAADPRSRFYHLLRTGLEEALV